MLEELSTMPPNSNSENEAKLRRRKNRNAGRFNHYVQRLAIKYNAALPFIMRHLDLLYDFGS